MNFIDCCNYVKENGCSLIRARKGTNEYDCKIYTSGSKRGWTYLDGFTASAVLSIYNNLGEENKLKYANTPALSAINIAWKIINKGA
jgi:hypothetical protein